MKPVYFAIHGQKNTKGNAVKLPCFWIFGAAVLVSNTAIAQLPSWNPEQTAVWEFVEQSWVDDVAENDQWPASYVHEKVVDWGDSQVAPRGRDKLTEWSRFDDESSNVLYYEITPAAIVVEDDTAVVHYHLFIITEDHADERDTSVLGLVETLVRQNGDWRYISLSGFEPRLNDDD